MIRDKLSKTCGDERYEIPAAVIDGITVSDPGGNAHPSPWEGLIDTGASRTVVPSVICAELGLSAWDYKVPSGFDREAAGRPIPLYRVRLAAAGLAELPLLVYGVKRSNILLGRDFLSGLLLMIDNEAGSWKLGCHTAWSKLLASCLWLR